MGYDFDAVVLGGGIGALAAAQHAVGLGAKTALVREERFDRYSMGTSAMRRRALLHFSRSPVDDFERMMARVQRVGERLDRQLSANLTERNGCHVIHGRPRLTSPHRVAVEATSEGLEGGRQVELSGRYIFVAGGSRPSIPAIPGASDAAVETGDTVFDLKRLPGSVAIVGADPEGVELAQAFNGLGVEVTVIDRGTGVAEPHDPELCSIIQEVLEDQGVRFRFGAHITQVVSTGSGSIIEIVQGGAVRSFGSELIVFSGARDLNTRGLGLEAAGVTQTASGLDVDQHWRTKTRNIFGVGSVTGLTDETEHVIESAREAVTHAFVKMAPRTSERIVPQSISTEPGFVKIGASEAELRAAGTAFEVIRCTLENVLGTNGVDSSAGMMKVFARQGSGRILGAVVLGADATAFAGALTLAIQSELTIHQLTSVRFPSSAFSWAALKLGEDWVSRPQNEGLNRFVYRALGFRADLAT